MSEHIYINHENCIIKINNIKQYELQWSTIDENEKSVDLVRGMWFRNNCRLLGNLIN